MKKIFLRIVFPFLVGFAVLIALGLPIGQALFTGICAITGMYIGQYFSKSRAEKKMNG
ncbi:MAG: hypothetical protein RIS20_1912 [Bacteroidota bacterium]|jgi:hypothetical protein